MSNLPGSSSFDPTKPYFEAGELEATAEALQLDLVFQQRLHNKMANRAVIYDFIPNLAFYTILWGACLYFATAFHWVGWVGFIFFAAVTVAETIPALVVVLTYIPLLLLGKLYDPLQDTMAALIKAIWPGILWCYTLRLWGTI